MSQSSQSILDHIAEMLRFISSAQSFWFTLNTSYDHGCHLASQFRLEPNDYEMLLVVASLAQYTLFGFAMKPAADISNGMGYKDGDVMTRGGRPG
jgi:hypothetical protein